MRGFITTILSSSFLLSSLLLQAQSGRVSGKVIDASDGTELIGVNIQIKGSLVGTATDLDGNYSIEANQGDVLVFTYVGYLTYELTVDTRSTVDISLEPDIENLSEVVIIGYGQVEQGDITGVVNKIDEKSFNKGMMTTPEQLLAGKVAGVQITQNSGEPGGGITVRMRGGTSITASNDPLYVVDGVPLDAGGVAGTRNSLNFINPADIADITVLKDASAAAIYGSRGANGVIIITTKSGKKGKPQITYDGSYSISSIVDQVDMLSTEEYIFTVERKGPRNLPRLGIIDPTSGENIRSDTDWLDEVLQTAAGQNHNLGISFGTKSNLIGRVSVNYQNLDGILNTSNTERVAGSINLTQKLLNDDLTISWNSKHSVTNNRFAPNVVGSALVYAPTQPILLEDGTYFQWSSNLAPRNPVEEIESTNNIGKVNRNLLGATINYNLPFIDGLSAKLNYAYDKSEGESQVVNEITPLFSERGGFSYFTDERSSTLFEAYLNYNKNTSIGILDLIGGYSYQEFDLRINNNLNLRDTVDLNDISVEDPLSFISDSQLNALLPFLQEVPSFPTENRLISFWGRANLTIKDKYLVTATLRRDGSTRFGENNRWGLFPSLALGWRVIDEPFMDGMQNVFQNLKVRLSYGITGNQDFGDYLYVETYNVSGDRAQYILGQDTINTYRPQGVDPNIKWEETESINFGIDYGLFDGRVNGTIDLYQKTTNDLLFTIAFPIGTLTRDRATTNIGEIQNQGIEFLINTIAINKEDLTLDLSFNAAYNRNEIIALDNSNLPTFQGYLTGGISGDVGQTAQVLRVGQPVNSFFVYQHKRDANGNPLNDSEDHNEDGIANDLDIYEDLNNDDIINEDDLRPYKDPAPDWILGLTANLAYKQFDVAATLRAQLGNYVYNNVASQYGAYEGVNDNFSPNNIHISAYENDFEERQLLSDVYVENASFLKLDNITLGYNFKIQNSLGARAYVTASNLLNISGYSGIDPEAGGFNGIDNNLYPRSRMFLVGVSLNLN